MNDEKQIMNIFAQAYQLIAKASKQQPSQEGFQQVLEMLGEDGIKQCAEVADQGPEAVAQAMVQILQQKSTQKAAKGTKLRYLMQLKGKCEPGYLKSGGKCKPCEMSKGSFRNKADLLGEGGSTPTNKKVPKKQGGNSIWNRLYGAITNEGVNGVGTRFNPVELPEVSVQSTKRYPFDVDRRSTNLGNGYSIISDAIFDSYGNDLTGYKGDLEPIRGLRTIYTTPSGRDTIYQNYNPNYQYSSDSSYPRGRWIPYESGYMPIASGSGDKKTFNRLLKKTTPDSRKKARIK